MGIGNNVLHTCLFPNFLQSPFSNFLYYQLTKISDTLCTDYSGAQFANISTLRAMRFHSGSGWDLLIWSQIPLEDETRGATEVVVLHKEGGTFGSCLLPSNASILPFFPVSTPVFIRHRILKHPLYGQLSPPMQLLSIWSTSSVTSG